MTRRRVAAVVITAAATVTGFVVVMAIAAWLEPRAELVARQQLPVDVAAEVDTVWAAFERVFPSRLAAIPDVELLLVVEVAGGDARYVVDEALIEIEIPTSPARFRDSLAHELAHHIEHTDPRFGEVRGSISQALGTAPESWFRGADWQTTPSEVWAEAVVEAMLGERVRYGRSMPLPPDVVEAVLSWGGAKSSSRG